MGAVKKRTHNEQEEGAADRRQFAPVLREAHARLGLWRTCDNTECRRRESCGGDADQCGARAAPQGWAWLNDVLNAMREGKSQDAAVEAANDAALDIRQRVTVGWKVKGWDPVPFVQLADGSWEHADLAPSRPDIDPQFFALVASPWLRNALCADAEV
jgi:hypothetical protein